MNKQTNKWKQPCKELKKEKGNTILNPLILISNNHNRTERLEQGRLRTLFKSRIPASTWIIKLADSWPAKLTAT